VGKAKKRIAEAATAYIAELPNRLPGARAELLPDEPYDDFDGMMQVYGPYDEVEDFDRLLEIHGLASDINERYSVDFFVLYEQKKSIPSHI